MHLRHDLWKKSAGVNWLNLDNMGAVDLINSFSVGGHTRHIDVKQCFLMDLKEAKKLIVN
jgi:hypothetical protein